MPVSIWRFWYRGYAPKLLTRHILNFIGIRPVRHNLFGMIATTRPERREGWLAQPCQLGRHAA